MNKHNTGSSYIPVDMDELIIKTICILLTFIEERWRRESPVLECLKFVVSRVSPYPAWMRGINVIILTKVVIVDILILMLNWPDITQAVKITIQWTKAVLACIEDNLWVILRELLFTFSARLPGIDKILNA